MKKHSIWSSFTGGFAGLCCAGTPVALSFLTGLGLGFLNSDLILFPLLFVSLGFMFSSLRYNKKDHLSEYPLFVAIGSAILILGGIFYRPVIWLGIIGLFAATIWDIVLSQKCKECGVEK